MPDCITKELNHLYEFIDAVDGKSNWVCKVCGDWFLEYEDAQP